MSACPSKNIHSLYVDNELSQSLRLNFEKHLDTCESCVQKVEQYINLRNNLCKFDVQHDNEEGYKRLKARLSYKTNVAPSRFEGFSATALRFAPVLAAVAVFAVFFPFMNSSVSNEIHSNISYSNEFMHGPYMLASNDSSYIAPIQTKGIVVENEVTLCRINANAGTLFSVTIDPAKFTEIDVFKPTNLKNDTSIDIIIFDSPAVVLHETDNFGFSRPVFLLRE